MRVLSEGRSNEMADETKRPPGRGELWGRQVGESIMGKGAKGESRIDWESMPGNGVGVWGKESDAGGGVEGPEFPIGDWGKGRSQVGGRPKSGGEENQIGMEGEKSGLRGGLEDQG